MNGINDERSLRNELDMLQGNINRMMVTESKQELDTMLRFALIRIQAIYEYRHRSL